MRTPPTLWLCIVVIAAACGPSAVSDDTTNNSTMTEAGDDMVTTGPPQPRTNGDDRDHGRTNNTGGPTTNGGPTNGGPTNGDTNNDTNNDTASQSNGGSNGGPVVIPPGGDTTEPVAIDTGSEPDTPGTYKGLPLALADNGTPNVTAVQGKIGIICVGMSNSGQECNDYLDKLARGWDADVSEQVVFVNCAVGGHAIEKWNNPANDGTLWDSCKNNKVPQAGITAAQVRVIFHKAANQFTTLGGGAARPFYPDQDSDYFVFYDNLTEFADRVTTEFPSVQAVYTTSRSYGGFNNRADRGEPLSYEEGHALNSWLADNPTVDGVWHGWGPYIWAPDCASGLTNGSDVCYLESDYAADAVHPAAGAKDKISQMLHDRFLSEPWFAR